MKYTFSLIILISFCLTVSCKQVNTKKEVIPVINKPEDLRKWILDETMKDYDRNTFGYDLKFIRQRKTPLLLHDEKFKSLVLISPEYQGRVITSTADGLQGYSFGWVNYDLIGSGTFKDHMNAFGGEDRVWLGPEGGQFSLFFKPKSTFEYDHWQVPGGFDTQTFDIVSVSDLEASFFKRLDLTNYAGNKLDIVLSRQIKLLSPAAFFVQSWSDIFRKNKKCRF